METLFKIFEKFSSRQLYIWDYRYVRFFKINTHYTTPQLKYCNFTGSNDYRRIYNLGI